MTRRRLYWMMGSVVGLIALCVAALFVAGNVFLKTDLAHEVINRRPEKLRVDYASARSPWPGRVVVEDFRIRGQTRKVQWEASADRLEGDIALMALVGKRFVASDVRGEGVVFRLRRRRDAFEELEVPASQTPPVSGLENPPERPPEEIYTLPEDRRRWTVELRDWKLDDVGEIWIDQYRYRGRAEVEGGFTVRLKRTTRVRPTTLEFRGGNLVVGEETVAGGVEGVLSIESDRFRHREVRGIETISRFDVGLEAIGNVRGVRFLNLYLEALPWLVFEEGGGELEADLQVADGSFRPGSSLRFRPSALVLRMLDYRARGSGRLDWAATERSGGSAELRTRFDDFSIERAGLGRPHVRGRGLTVAVTSGDLSIPPSFEGSVVRADLPVAEVPDFSFYNAYIPEAAGIEITGGSGTISGRFELRTDGGTGSGGLDLEGRDVRAAWEDGTITGDLRLRSRFPTIDLERRRFGLGGSTIRIEEGRILGGGFAGGTAKPWWAEATLVTGSVEPGAETTLETSARFRMQDSRPIVGLFALAKGLPGWIQRAVRVDDVHGRARLRVGPGFVDLERFRVEGERLAARGGLRFAEGNRRGRLLLTYRGLDLGVALRGEESDYKLIDAVEWYERRVDDDGR